MDMVFASPKLCYDGIVKLYIIFNYVHTRDQLISIAMIIDDHLAIVN